MHFIHINSDWPEWSNQQEISTYVTFARNKATKGQAYSKHTIAQSIASSSDSKNSAKSSVKSSSGSSMESNDVIVFLEYNAVVSEDWLAPLYHTLKEHPQSGNMTC